MQDLNILNPIPEKILGNKVIISNSVFSQLIEYINIQTSAINSLIESFRNLTENVNSISEREMTHYNQITNDMWSQINNLTLDISKLQQQVSTLAKSISIFLGGE